jgi:Aerotolerance regulator N-terminal/von Willebrand factor type A domain
MAFVNLSLLAGGFLVAIPVVLHLIMRQRPKPFVFPALRFIHERRLANQRRLQLRHWLLLALRCGAIGLFALALARPSVVSGAVSSWLTAGVMAALAALTGLMALIGHVRGLSRIVAGSLAAIAVALVVGTLFIAGRALAGKSPVLGDQESPISAAIVIDTSPRMQYRHENKTRLEAAQDLAQWLLRQLPAESELAILDSRSLSAAFAVDRTAAEKNIERLRTAGTARPLSEVVQAAAQLLKQKQQRRKEIYVLTDLTAAAWKPPASGSELKSLLATQTDTLLYLIDVGVEKPRNFALGELTLSGDVLPAGSELVIETQVSASGIGGERTVELWVEHVDPTLPIIRDGKPVLPKADLRESRSIRLSPGSKEQVQFKVTGSVGDTRPRTDGSRVGLQPGTHHGWVRLVGQDGLAIDDVRYFAAEVQPAWSMLLVAPPTASTRYLAEALAPRELRDSGRASFRCESIDQSRLASQELADFRAIALLDPEPLPADVWNKLAEYCERGGGLAIFLGHNAQPPASFQDPAAAKVLGGKLTRQTRTGGSVYLAPSSYEHPVMAGLRPYSTSVPWDLFPVFYHWNLDELVPNARAVIPYGDGKPALVENRLGQGNVLVMTTPISDPARPKNRQTWNELATGEEAWPCFALVYEMMLHLVRSGQTRLNLLAGETALLPNDPTEYPERYQLFTPLDQPQDVRGQGGRISVRFTDQPGAYRLRGQKAGPLVRGFAVNLAGDTSDLTRLTPTRLDEILGASRYQLAKSKEEIDRAVGSDRIGSEFYPTLVTFLALLLGLEHLLANRFYRKTDS